MKDIELAKENDILETAPLAAVTDISTGNHPPILLSFHTKLMIYSSLINLTFFILKALTLGNREEECNQSIST